MIMEYLKQLSAVRLYLFSFLLSQPHSSNRTIKDKVNEIVILINHDNYSLINKKNSMVVDCKLTRPGLHQ